MSSATRPLVIATAFAASLIVGLLILFWTMGGVSKVAQPAAIGGPFQLTDQNGKAVTDKSLKGKPTLIFFGYTHCPDVCPTSLFEISEVLRAMGKDADKVNAIFISVDPERDTPERLAEYAERFDVEPGRWIFLTGDKPQIRSLVQEGFHLGIDEPSPEELAQGAEAVLHSTRFVLVDPQGRIRGYYDGNDDEGAPGPRRPAEAPRRCQARAAAWGAEYGW